MKIMTLNALKLNLLVAGLFATSLAYAQSAGTVTFSAGVANITHADDSVTPAVKSAVLNAGDTIETKEGRLQLSLIDGGKVSLQPNTIYKINKYEFAAGKEDGSEFAFTELIKGGLRTVSGLIGHKNRDHYQLKTAVATIGIRGTEFTVNFNDNNLLMTTNHGSVDVCNQGGCLNAETGQTIAVAGVGASPKPSSKAAKAAAAAPAGKAAFAANDTVTDVNSLIAKVGYNPPVASLANYSGPAILSAVLKTDCYCGNDGVLELEHMETNANSQPINMNTAENQIGIQSKTFSVAHTDGIVSWGRLSGGTLKEGGIDRTIEWMDYAVGVRPDPAQLASITGTYTVFGSTAPILVDNISPSRIIGAEKLVTGTIKFNLASPDYKYDLSIPIQPNSVNRAFDDVINLTGQGSLLPSGAIYATSGQSNITSQGITCFGNSCSGVLLAGNNVLQGTLIGAKGERIGLQYGVGVAPLNGAVYGTVVLKK